MRLSEKQGALIDYVGLDMNTSDLVGGALLTHEEVSALEFLAGRLVILPAFRGTALTMMEMIGTDEAVQGLKEALEHEEEMDRLHG